MCSATVEDSQMVDSGMGLVFDLFAVLKVLLLLNSINSGDEGPL